MMKTRQTAQAFGAVGCEKAREGWVGRGMWSLITKRVRLKPTQRWLFRAIRQLGDRTQRAAVADKSPQKPAKAPSAGERGSKGERPALNSRDDSGVAFLLSAVFANELIFSY